MADALRTVQYGLDAWARFVPEPAASPRAHAEASQEPFHDELEPPLSQMEECYLHLVTDAYSKKIVGWCLAESLAAVFTLKALRMAIEQAGGGNLSGLIHHSDRGIQYCCDLYVEELQKYGIQISMTEDYKPTDNALAERVNGIIKGESVYRQNRRFETYEEAQEHIGRFVDFYNGKRPHYSIGLQTPNVAHEQTGEQRRMWKTKIYQKNEESLQNNP